MKKLNLVHRGKCRGFFVNFLRPFSLAIKGRKLGGHFGPEKKYLPPPPKNSPIRRRHPPGPSAPPGPPPSWDFQSKSDPPPPPGTSDSPFPLPDQKKMKKHPKRPPRKCANNFAKVSPHFSPISCKNFARTSLWGIAGTRHIGKLSSQLRSISLPLGN